MQLHQESWLITKNKKTLNHRLLALINWTQSFYFYFINMIKFQSKTFAFDDYILSSNQDINCLLYRHEISYWKTKNWCYKSTINPIFYCKIYRNFRLLIITFYYQIKIIIVYFIDLKYLIGWQKIQLSLQSDPIFYCKICGNFRLFRIFIPTNLFSTTTNNVCHARQVLVVLCNPSWADLPLVAKVSQLVTRCRRLYKTIGLPNHYRTRTEPKFLWTT